MNVNTDYLTGTKNRVHNKKNKQRKHFGGSLVWEASAITAPEAVHVRERQQRDNSGGRPRGKQQQGVKEANRVGNNSNESVQEAGHVGSSGDESVLEADHCGKWQRLRSRSGGSGGPPMMVIILSQWIWRTMAVTKKRPSRTLTREKREAGNLRGPER